MVKLSSNKNDYWEKREKEWLDKQTEADNFKGSQLRELYDKSFKNIQSDINNFYAKYASDTGLSMDEARKRIDKFSVEGFQDKAAEMVKNKDFSDYANDRLKLYNSTMKINRLEYLKSQVGQELVNLGATQEKDMGDMLTQSYMDAAKHQAGVLGVSMRKDITKVARTVVSSSFQGATWSQRIWTNNDVLKAKLDTLLTRSMVQGIGPIELARQLRSQVSNEVKNARYVSERLMRTETARVQDSAAMDSFKKNGFNYIKWIAEVSACDQCLDIAAENDGVYSIDKAPVIPEHPNCRCSKAAYMPRSKEEAAEIDKLMNNIENPEDIQEHNFFNDDLKSNFPKEDISNMEKSLSNAPKEIQMAWKRYSPEFKIGNMNHNDESFFRPSTGKVTLDYETIYATKGNEVRNKYDVVFHEFGHAIDNFANGKEGTLSSNSKYNLKGIMDKDYKNWMDNLVAKKTKEIDIDKLTEVHESLFGDDTKYGHFNGDLVIFNSKTRELNPATVRKIVEKELNNSKKYKLGTAESNEKARAIGDVSDMIVGASENKIWMLMGHSKDYFMSNGARQTEAFAEMTSAAINNPASLAKIKEVFPNGYKTYLKMMKDIANG